jgi:hypothetical protein
VPIKSRTITSGVLPDFKQANKVAVMESPSNKRGNLQPFNPEKNNQDQKKLVSVSRATAAAEAQKDTTKHRVSYVRDDKEKQEKLLDCFCTHEGKCVLIFMTDPRRCEELEGFLFHKVFTSTRIESDVGRISRS